MLDNVYDTRYRGDSPQSKAGVTVIGTMFATFAKIGALVLFLDVTLRETAGPEKDGARFVVTVLFLLAAYLILRSATRPRRRRAR